MKCNGYIWVLLLFTFLPLCSVFATHNRAGEIRIEQIGPLTLRATIITYTKASSVNVDRDSLEIDWGNGTKEWVQRTNGNGLGVVLPNDIRFNTYVAVHTYSGRATYTISMTDPNRNGGIINVNRPNSEAVPFYIETVYTFLSPQFQGFNNSPILLQPPIDIGCVGKRFIHNPSAFDPDGDSLAYELIVPKQSPGMDVPSYNFPNQISPGGNNFIRIDPVTGDFIWESPQVAAEYNIAILIKEYRNGRLISTTIRDLQILIRNCDNRPPRIETIDELCVVAGDTIRLPITVTDPDRNPIQEVRIEARGGPLEQEISPAFLLGPTSFVSPPLNATLFWATSCEHINPEYYNVTIRAVDDFYDTTGLADLKTIRIKVIGPAPQNLRAEPQRDVIILRWASPYTCDMPVDGSFRGFRVWRKNISEPIDIDSCAPDLASQGYVPIAFALRNQVGQNYIYRDEDITKGRTYCYRITGEFAEFTSSGNPYNISESLPSNAVCTQLLQDIPLLTHVSVVQTAANTGMIDLLWEPPDPEALDTMLHPPPYQYVVERREANQGNFSPIPNGLYTANSFRALAEIDSLRDEGLQTADTRYEYRIAFYTNGDFLMPFGYSEPATSIFLSTIGDDQMVTLDWQERVPWSNFTYHIYKQNRLSGEFDSIGSVIQPPFVDEEVVNDSTYCYRILSLGTYQLEQQAEIYENWSQIECSVPVDSSAPCLPDFTVQNICDNPQSAQIEDRENVLAWSYDSPSCELPSDLNGFRIYRTNDPNEPPVLLAEVSGEERQWIDEPNEQFVCYAIQTIDQVGNVSELSTLQCVEICPSYVLPNAFSPNGDEMNDLFVPRENRFVDQVEFQVYNRWGGKVFETSVPEINWDGRDQNGNDLPEGTYYYQIRLIYAGVNQSEILGPSELTGFIELIR